MRKLFGMLKTAVQDFLADDCMSNGAALAYYTIFSLPPLMVVVFYVASLAGVSQERIDQVVRQQLGIPATAAQGGETGSSGENPDAQASGSGGTPENSGGSGEAGGGGSSLRQVAERQSSQSSPLQSLGPVSRIIGVLILVFSATGVFGQLQLALNRAWEVQPDPDQGGWKNFLMKRVLSLGMVAVIAFLLLVSLVLTTLVDEGVRLIMGSDPGGVGQVVGIILNNLLTVVVATILFAAMYKLLPDATMRWKDMWVGALITAILFVIGKTAIGWYLQNSEMGGVWGSAASSMVALLVWVYYSSLIVLFGAELTQVWANQYGHGIEPEPGAVRVVEETKKVQ